MPRCYVPTWVQGPLVNFEPDPTFRWQTRATCVFMYLLNSAFVEKVSCLSQRKCSYELSSFSSLRVGVDCLSEFEYAITHRSNFDQFEPCILCFWLKLSPERPEVAYSLEISVKIVDRPKLFQACPLARISGLLTSCCAKSSSCGAEFNLSVPFVKITCLIDVWGTF